MIEFTVWGRPVPAGSKTQAVSAKTGKRWIRDSSGSRGDAWRRTIKRYAKAAMEDRAPLAGPLTLELDFFLKRPKAHYNAAGLKPSAPLYPIDKGKPDTTKLVRAVEDALNGLVWGDDSQVVWQLATKRFDNADRVIVRVKPVDDYDERAVLRDGQLELEAVA